MYYIASVLIKENEKYIVADEVFDKVVIAIGGKKNSLSNDIKKIEEAAEEIKKGNAYTFFEGEVMKIKRVDL